ncbi:MAG: AMP-binding protein, partial [Alphaproteobacteria bacterium]
MADSQSPADFPLLIKSLLRTPLQIARDVEIVSDGLVRYSYADLEDRLQRFGAGLQAQGVKQGDVVAVMDWDTHRYFEAFFAVPMLGA